MAIYRFDVRHSNSNMKNKKNATRTNAAAHCDYVSREGEYSPTSTNAKDHSDYVTRKGNFSGDNYEDLVYAEHFNMPSFAEDNPKYFWECAEKYEGTNRVTYKEFEIGLPHELSTEQNIEIARGFCDECFGKEFVYSMGVHKKPSSNGEIDNIHFHVMFSERELDGIERTPELFFKKANKKEPEKGGAVKNVKWSKMGAIKDYRKKWEVYINKELEKVGLEKISCETLIKQKLNAIKAGDLDKADCLERVPTNLSGTISIKIKKSGIKSLSKSERQEYEFNEIAKEIRNLKLATYSEIKNKNIGNNSTELYDNSLEDRTVEVFLKDKLSYYQDKLSSQNNLSSEEREVYADLLIHVNENLEELREKKRLSLKSIAEINKDIHEEIEKNKNYLEQYRKNKPDQEVLDELERILAIKEEIILKDVLVSTDEITDLNQLVKRIDLDNGKYCTYNFFEDEKAKVRLSLEEKRIEAIAVSKLSASEKSFYKSHIKLKKAPLDEKEEKYKNQVLNKVIRSSAKVKENLQKKLDTLSNQQEEYKNFSDLSSLVKGLSSDDTNAIKNFLRTQYLEEIDKCSTKIDTLNIVQKEMENDSTSEKKIASFENKKSKVKSFAKDIKEKGYDSSHITDIKEFEKGSNTTLKNQLLISSNLDVNEIEILIVAKYNEMIKKEKYSNSAKKSRIENQIKSLYSSIEISKKKIDNITEIFSHSPQKESVSASVFVDDELSKNVLFQLLESKSKLDLVDYKVERINEILKDGKLDESQEKYYRSSLAKLISEKESNRFNKNEIKKFTDDMINEHKKSISLNFNEHVNTKINEALSKVEFLNTEINKIEKDVQDLEGVTNLINEKEKIKKEYINKKSEGDYFKCISELEYLKQEKNEDKNTSFALEILENKKEKYEHFELDQDINRKLQEFDIRISLYQEKQDEKLKVLKNELKEQYSEIKLCDYFKSNIKEHLDYINFVFEDREDISEYKKNPDKYSVTNKFELENKMLSRYLYLEEMKTNVHRNLRDENKILNNVVSRLSSEENEIYQNYISSNQDPEDKTISVKKNEIERSIESSSANIKEYLRKRLEHLDSEQLLYVCSDDPNNFLKSMSASKRNECIKNLIESNNSKIKILKSELSELDNSLVEGQRYPTQSSIISKLEANKKNIKEYSLNKKTGGEYFKCLKEIEGINSDKKTDSKIKIERLNTLNKLKSEYEKIDTKDVEVKLISKYNSMINKYKNIETEKTKNIKNEIQKKSNEINVAKLSSKLVKEEAAQGKEKKNKFNINTSNGHKIHSAFDMREDKRKREKDSATKMVAEQVDGIEN